jgi:hypothetical protein
MIFGSDLGSVDFVSKHAHVDLSDFRAVAWESAEWTVNGFCNAGNSV